MDTPQAAPAASPEAQALKEQLLQALDGTDRGIFGTTVSTGSGLPGLVFWV